jgi:hypothetical protein
MVAVDEGEVEASTLADEARKDYLGLLCVKLDEVQDPRVIERLQAAVGEPRRLVGSTATCLEPTDKSPSRPSQRNNVAIAYPSPTSIVRLAPPRRTQRFSASPSSAPTATGKRS